MALCFMLSLGNNVVHDGFAKDDDVALSKEKKKHAGSEVLCHMNMCVILEKSFCFVQVWGDEKEVVHQSHQTSTRHRGERKRTHSQQKRAIKQKDCPLLLQMCYYIYGHD